MLILVLACLPATVSPSTSSNSNTAASLNLPSIIKPISTTDTPLSVSHHSPYSLRPLQGVYVVSHDPFPEVETFVASSSRQYHLELARYALPMRAALEVYLGEKTGVKAIFVGTRRTDPHGEFLTHFDPTDNGWPQFVRIHPVIDWHYAEIWAVSAFFLCPFRLVLGICKTNLKAGSCWQKGQ